MNILLATMQFGRGYAQGTERYLSILRRGLSASGHTVTILAGDPELRGPRLRLGDAVPGEAGVLHLPHSGRLAVRGLPAEAYDELLTRLEPDVVHLANPAHVGIGLAEATLQRGLPLVVTIMDFWWLCPKQTLWHAAGRVCEGEVNWSDCLHCDARTHPRRLLRGLARLPMLSSVLLPVAYGRWGGLAPGVAPEQRRVEHGLWPHRRAHLLGLLECASAVICPSEAARQRCGARLTPGRVHSIPYGLEAHWFAPRKRPELGCDSAGAQPGDRPDGGPVIGFAGALTLHKGPHVLLSALRRLGWRDVRVRLAGGGDEPGYLEQLRAAAMGLPVEFVGRLAPEAMPDFLDRLDLLVIPSLWLENLPLIVLEGLARGVEVLGSDRPGIAEILPDSHCFAAGAADELAARLAAWRGGLLPRCSPRRPLSSAAQMVADTEAIYATLVPPGSAG